MYSTEWQGTAECLMPRALLTHLLPRTPRGAVLPGGAATLPAPGWAGA